jgi:hypothetical protein
MIRPEHPFDIRPNLRKAETTTAESVIRPKQLVRTSLHQKCTITEPKLMKIKRSKIYNNPKSIIVN